MSDMALAIEISNPSSGPRGRIDPDDPQFVAGPSVALGRFDDPQVPTLIGAEPLSDQSRHDDDLMPAIDRLCRRHSVRPGDLAHLAISIGPGGYTSLRIAVATAKLLAEATGASTIAVSSAAVAAYTIPIQPPAVVCLASKGETAWCALLPPVAGDPWWRETGTEALRTLLTTGKMSGSLEEMHRCATDGFSWISAMAPLGVHGADLIRILKPGLIIGDRFLPPDMRKAAEEAGASIAEPVFSAGSVLSLAMGKEPTDPLALVPFYPRVPEAVIQWHKRGN